MKLLKKSVLVNELAEQRKSQIDEGMAIARKVDILRQTLASLEKQQADFLNGMEAELQKRTKFLLDEIADRERIVITLEDRRKKLLVPLDAEWSQLEQAKKGVLFDKELVKKGLEKIAEKEAKAEEKYQASKTTLARINARERELIKVYDRAELDAEETEKIKVKALEDKARLDKYAEEQNDALLKREAEVAVAERENSIEKDRLENYKKNLEKATKQLEDRINTQERNEQRIKRRK
jgi:hypothetical protein